MFLLQVISGCASPHSLIGGSVIYPYHCYNNCRKIWEMLYESYLEACVKVIRLMNEQGHALLSFPNLISIKTLGFG